MTDFRARVVLEAAVGSFQQGMQAARREVTGLTTAAQQQSASMTSLGLAMGAAGTAIGLGLRKAGRDAVTFESALTKSVTQIGVARVDMQEMGEAALRLGDTGKGPLELADALFFIQSAGLRGATALDTLEQSAKASSIGLGETKVVADLATSAMNAYGANVLSASAATDVMIATVREGKAPAADLAASMGRVLPIAAEMGVSFDEVGAAVAAMTRTGTDAATSTTQLRAVLTSLLKPADQSERALSALGLSSAQLRDVIKHDGLWAALMLLRDAIGDNDAALGTIFPNVRALAGFLDLTGANAAENAAIFERMADTVGLTDQAFEEWSTTMEASIDRFTAAAEAARVASMEGLHGPLTAVLDAGTDLLQMYVDLPGPVRTATTVTAALAAGVLVLGGSFLVLAPRIVATHQAMQQLAVAAPRAAAGLRAVSAAAGIIGLLGAVAGAIFTISRATRDAGPGVNEMTRALLDLQEAADASAFRDFLGVTPRAVLDLQLVGLSAEEASQAIMLSSENIESLDSALAAMVASRDPDRAARSLRAFAEAAGGIPTDQLLADLPQYRDALAQADVAQRTATESAANTQAGLQTLANQFGIVGDEAAQGAQDMLDEWTSATADFVSLTGAWEQALAEKEEAERKAAEETAKATSDASDSWEDYVGDVELSLDEYLTQLEEMLAAQEAWAVNMGILAARVPPAVLDELARLGPEGAPLVAKLVDASDAELDRLVADFDRQSQMASGVIQRNFAEATPVLAKIGREQGMETVAALVAEMVSGAVDVRTAARNLGIDIDKGIGADRRRNIPVGFEVDRRSYTRVLGQIDHLARRRTAWIDVKTGTVHGSGPFAHGGGLITSAGVVPRFHAGRAGLAADEVFAVLQTGERVLSRAQNDAFERMVRTLGVPTPAFPGSGRGGFGAGDGAPRQMIVQNLNVEVVGPRPSLRDIYDEAAFRGAA